MWLDSARGLRINCCQPQIWLLHPYPSPYWTALAGMGSGLPCTRSYNTSRSFFLAGVTPSYLTFFQLIIFFRSETSHFSTSFDVNKVNSSLIYWLFSLYSCMFFFCVPSCLTRAASFLSHFTTMIFDPALKNRYGRLHNQWPIYNLKCVLWRSFCVQIFWLSFLRRTLYLNVQRWIIA